jgi:hypothetical protein
MRARLAELFVQLRKDSGLDDWEKLGPLLDPSARSQQAYAIAQRSDRSCGVRSYQQRRQPAPWARLRRASRHAMRAIGSPARLTSASVPSPVQYD